MPGLHLAGWPDPDHKTTSKGDRGDLFVDGPLRGSTDLKEEIMATVEQQKEATSAGARPPDMARFVGFLEAHGSVCSTALSQIRW
ncbi:hypothetical protein ACFVW1_47365 [Streptomyces olivochromogenes]|uniref:hypothetical protein n=1 Tax=Streptomyces olivochromogenes TaxID=1963 RepID=UPI0036DDE583